MRFCPGLVLAAFLVAVVARGEEREAVPTPALARTVIINGARILSESSPELSDVPHVAVAENDDELSELWSAYRVPGEPPAVDFRERFILVTAYAGLGDLIEFVLTSEAELIHKSRWRQRAPVQTLELPPGHEDRCPRLGVRVVSFPRSYFPKGSYTLGPHFGAPTFTVRGGARTPRPLEALPPIPAPPESAETAKPIHPRRARIILASNEQRVGIWVRDDAAWSPDEPRPENEWSVYPPAKLVCDEQTCARVLATLSCYRPECPNRGSLLIVDRKLGSRGPWPLERGPWERLMLELKSDPELERLLPGAPVFPEPYDPPPKYERPIGMASSQSRRFYPEFAAAAEGALLPRADTWLAGASLRLALRKTHPVSDTTTGGHIAEAVAGDGWGLDLRFKLLREFDTVGRPRTFLSAGAAIAAENAIGRSTTEGRLRVPSILGFLLPEVGAAAFLEEPVHLYTSHGLPFDFLLTQGLALEMRPAFTLVYGAAPNGDPEALFSLSLGLMGRIAKKDCP
jgi:hypothetical protein